MSDKVLLRCFTFVYNYYEAYSQIKEENKIFIIVLKRLEESEKITYTIYLK